MTASGSGACWARVRGGSFSLRPGIGGPRHCAVSAGSLNQLFKVGALSVSLGFSVQAELAHRNRMKAPLV